MTTVMMEGTSGVLPRCGTEVRVSWPALSDIDAVLAMLARCSRHSLFHRFHGFSDGVAYFGSLLRDRPLDQTLLGWAGATCVGVASLCVGAAGIADLGVLVEDAWQRRGVGTLLAASLLEGAREKGVTTAHAEVLGEDQFILRALHRIAPLTGTLESGRISVDIKIAAAAGTGRNPVRRADGMTSHGALGTSQARPAR